MALQFKNIIFVETPQYKQALEFYRDQIGLTVRAEHETWAELKMGDGCFIIAQTAEALGPVVEYETDDQASDKARLLAAGCELIRENTRGDQCYLRDPFGFVINLYRKKMG